MSNHSCSLPNDVTAMCVLCQRVCVSLYVCIRIPVVSMYVVLMFVTVFFLFFFQTPVISFGRYQLSVTSTLPVPAGVSGKEDEQELLSH